MASSDPMPSSDALARLRHGLVIPAHPLALTARRRLDERRQRALIRYYRVAVGVHTTQFAIREKGLLKPVLALAAAEAGGMLKVAGICGPTKQAAKEASLARDLGYDIGLLSLAALKDASDGALIAHAKAVAKVLPLFGFYLQPSVGGRVLSYEFWRRFAEIPNVVAIKMAPFNRYRTIDVVRAVADAGRAGDIALYTGNDDNIILDLLTPYVFHTGRGEVSLQIVGGLLGQWACWTRKAVEHLKAIKRVRKAKEPIPQEILTLASQMTLANKAIFDADNSFTGCIPGISYVLKQQGLMSHIGMLDPSDRLSPGQTDQVDHIIRQYPHLTDVEFVQANLDKWLSP